MPPRSARPELSEALERIVLKALAKDRDQRFGSAAELREALLPLRPAPGAKPSLPGQTQMQDAEDDRATMAPSSGKAPAADQDSIETAAAQVVDPTPPGVADPLVPPTLFTPPEGQPTLVTPPEGQPTAGVAEATPAPPQPIGATPTAAPTAHFRDPTPPWQKAKATPMPDTFAVAVTTGAESGRGRAAPWIVLGAVLLLLLLAGGSIAAWVALSSRSTEPAVTAAQPLEPPAAVATTQPYVPPHVPVPAPVPTPPPPPTKAAPATPDGGASTAVGDAGSGEDPGIAAAPSPDESPSKRLTKERPSRPLSQQEVRAALGTHRSALRSCIGLARPAPTVVRVRVSVDGHGVGRYETAAPAPPAKVTACLRRTIARARFRASGGDRISVVIPVRRAQQEKRTTDSPGSPLRPSPFGS